MTYKSLAMSFRIQLGFHAANNEGAGGTNVMEPRRITVGDKEYDGISGEIIRHHILEKCYRAWQSHNDSPQFKVCVSGILPIAHLDETVGNTVKEVKVIGGSRRLIGFRCLSNPFCSLADGLLNLPNFVSR